MGDVNEAAEMDEIRLPDAPPPTSLERQIKAAIYAAAAYYRLTKITHGHRVVYLIDEWTYQRLVAGGESQSGPPDAVGRVVQLPPCEVCGFSDWPAGGMHAARSIHMRAHGRWVKARPSLADNEDVVDLVAERIREATGLPTRADAQARAAIRTLEAMGWIRRHCQGCACEKPPGPMVIGGQSSSE